MIRVLLAEDMHMVRGALVALLDLEEDLRVVADVARGDEILPAARTHRPDVAVIDVDLPGLDGITAAGLLRERMPSCRTLILTGLGKPGTLRRAMSAQVFGYLLKDAEAEDVLEGIRAVSRGESPIHPKAARQLLGARMSSPPVQLTTRETEVLRLVKDGLANKQIARRLNISERTVKAHLTSAFARIGVQDRTQAALWVERNGL